MAAGTIDPVRALLDPETFFRVFLKIRDREKRLIPFVLNPAQRHYLANRTNRDIILKARQLGFSTLLQGLFFHACVTSTQTVMTIAHLDSTTQALRRINDRFYQHMPEGFRPERRLSNAVVSTFPDFDSEMLIATAGSRNTGRGSTVTMFHASEVAFWPDATALMAGALQSVPLDGVVVLESSANGQQGYFYDEVMKAVRGESLYRLHFYPWWWEGTYRADVEGPLELEDDEGRLVAAHGLDDEQIMWRRRKRLELGDFFQQEYPETVEQAFVASGNSVFVGVDSVLYNPLEHAYDGRPVVIGVDWGQADDATAVSVMDDAGCEVALVVMRRMPWADMRRRIILLAEQYNVVRVYAEKNSIGSVNIEALRAESAEALGRELDVVAFEMTQTRKGVLVGRLSEALSKGAVRLIDDPVATAELRAYQTVQSRNGQWSYAHPPGGHDDTVDARMLALWGVESMYGRRG